MAADLPNSPEEWEAPMLGRRLSAPGRMSIVGSPRAAEAKRKRRDRRMQMRAESGPMTERDAVQNRIRRLITTNQICIGFVRGGGKLTKFPRRGFKPIPRQYRVSMDQKRIEWIDDLNAPFIEATGSLALGCVTHLREGARTPTFERFAKDLPRNAASRCFSLVYVDEKGKRERSLDLLCPSSAVCSAWAQGLDALLQVEWLRNGRMQPPQLKKLPSMRSIGTQPIDRETLQAMRDKHQSLVIAAKQKRLEKFTKKEELLEDKLQATEAEVERLSALNESLREKVEDLERENARLRSMVEPEGGAAGGHAHENGAAAMELQD